MKNNKTNSKHFKIFKRECQLWLDRFGLKDWKIGFFHEEHNDFESRAWFSANGTDSIASIGLSDDWGGDKVTTQRVKVCAIHEVLHVLFAKMSICNDNRFVLRGHFEDEEHSVIRRFENFFYGRAD